MVCRQHFINMNKLYHNKKLKFFTAVMWALVANYFSLIRIMILVGHNGTQVGPS